MAISRTKTAPAPAADGTHQRLLAAAARVFARRGLAGATTREIAREARVNEVTLFRHFKTKQKLLSEVVRSTFDQQDAALAALRPPPLPAPAAAARGRSRPRPAASKEPPDLRQSLRQVARRYEEVLRTNMPFVRTMIGEIHRYSEHELRVLTGIFAPLKAEILATVQTAQRARRLRPGIKPALAADCFGGMIFMDALRRSGPTAPDYSSEEQYRNACAELFARGIERVS